MSRILFGLALLISAAAPPTAPVIPHVVLAGDLSRPAGRPIVLDGSRSTAALPLSWHLAGYAPEASARPGYAPTLVQFDGAGKKKSIGAILDPEPGRYTIVAVAVGTDNDGDSLPDLDIAAVEVTITPGPAGAVSPAPPSRPAPKPTAAVPLYHVALILDPARLSLPIAAIRADPTIRGRLAALGAAWHTYESTSPEIDRYNYRKYIDKAGGPPALIVQDGSSGKVLLCTPAPADEGAILDHVAALRAAQGGH